MLQRNCLRFLAELLMSFRAPRFVPWFRLHLLRYLRGIRCSPGRNEWAQSSDGHSFVHLHCFCKYCKQANTSLRLLLLLLIFSLLKEKFFRVRRYRSHKARQEAELDELDSAPRQFLCNRPISVSYAYKKETKGERQGLASPKLEPRNLRNLLDFARAKGIDWKDL